MFTAAIGLLMMGLLLFLGLQAFRRMLNRRNHVPPEAIQVDDEANKEDETSLPGPVKPIVLEPGTELILRRHAGGRHRVRIMGFHNGRIVLRGKNNQFYRRKRSTIMRLLVS